MRLDHVSYVTTHDQLADTVQRLGSRLGTTFVDGGIHPRFGTRNFTAPLLDGRYIEVVCPLEHPATENSPWGKTVSKKAEEGGGWLTWVFSTDDISTIEEKFGRKSVDGHRTRPDGTDLKWKQIGVSDIEESRELPFFIQWLSNDHPSKDGKPVAAMHKIIISSPTKLDNSFFKNQIIESTKDLIIEWDKEIENDDLSGIVRIEFELNSQIVSIE
jgi:hypothetical protein